jgi:NAD(P)-dependent dehydrogenase (short-subunit alcohol dehydrogenase family)
MEAKGTAVVTGASRGLGRAIAIELAERGFDVIAGMRDPARADVRDARSFEIPSDLRVLVNNAGVRGAYLPVEEAPSDYWRDTFETNVFGLAELCRRAIPALRASRGVLCNVSSASLLVPLPFFAVYRASKAAVSALCDTLRVELAPFGVRVVEILPGPIDTDLLNDSVMRRAPDAIRFEPYAPMAKRSMTDESTSTITTPRDAARAIADAILAEGGPLRVGCDPVSTAMLARWRVSSDEDALRESLARFGVK